MLAYVEWDFDPLLVHIWGPIEIRWYGLIFVCTLIAAFLLWRWQMGRGGFSKEVIEGFIIWGALATIVGARLGHCFFYDILPAAMDGRLLESQYVRNPLKLLAFWEGGLASHGATVGLALALWIFSRRQKIPMTEIMDRFAPSAAVGSAGIRLGNFLNSEIVGRVTDLPWAVKFLRARELHLRMDPRHPSQLYEFAMGLLVLLAVCLVDRIAGRERRPRALLGGVFLLLYFTGRFCVEFFKEYQALERRESLLTMGQYLSIIPIGIGGALVVWSLLRRTPTRSEQQIAEREAQASRAQKASDKPDATSANKKKRRRRKQQRK